MSQFNFSPQPFKTRDPRLMGLVMLNVVLLIGLVGALLYWQQLRAGNALVHAQLDDLRTRQENILGDNGDLIQELEAVDIKTYRKQVSRFRGIQAAFGTHWGGLLDDLGRILPEDVRVLSIEPHSSRDSDAAMIRLAGEARTKEAQLAFVRVLQERPGFQNVRFETEVYDQPPVVVSFEIMFEYTGGEG